MLRKLLVGGAIAAISYLAGTLFGYRAAVVDYVENDARTIESMADTMYETPEPEEMPEAMKEAIEEARGEGAEASDGRKGFQ